jgi:type II secretory pathway pseudopilin PulG
MIQRRRLRSGYSFVEIVVMVLVLGILAAVAAPKYSRALAIQRADAAARRMAADLRMARQYARTASQPQTVAFDATADSYAASSMPDPDRPGQTYAVSLSASQYFGDILSPDFGGAATIQFDVFGRPNSSGSVKVRSGGRECTVTVDSVGEVRIQ